MKVFVEEQRFRQLWLFMILIISLGIPLVIIALDVFKSDGTDSEALIGLIVVVISTFLTFGLIYSMRLKTRIDEKGIHYQFWPFHWSLKQISWEEIQTAEFRKYDPLGEYGGWGIKGFRKHGRAYNVSGDKGIQLVLKNGKKVLFGTQLEHEAKQVLTTYRDKLTNHDL